MQHLYLCTNRNWEEPINRIVQCNNYSIVALPNMTSISENNSLYQWIRISKRPNLKETSSRKWIIAQLNTEKKVSYSCLANGQATSTYLGNKAIPYGFWMTTCVGASDQQILPSWRSFPFWSTKTPMFSYRQQETFVAFDDQNRWLDHIPKQMLHTQQNEWNVDILWKFLILFSIFVYNNYKIHDQLSMSVPTKKRIPSQEEAPPKEEKSLKARQASQKEILQTSHR